MNLRTLFVLLAVTAALPSAAEESLSAKDIARRARERGGLNLGGLTAELKLTTTRDGKTREQVLRTSAKEIDGRVHSLARFLQPATVAGVAVLTIEGLGDDADDLSIWLPKLKRVRKVAASQRGQSFMDTDFNYADLGGTGAEEEKVERLGDEKVDGRDAYVLRGEGGAGSPYGKVTLYVDKETWVPLKVEYQDRDGKPFKRYRTVKLKRFQERVIAAESVMEDLRSGSKTTLQILKLEASTLGDEAFSERALERG
ncbi:MAG: outer membrane lipoprotein-sorting protein [Myxococcaceae bacterium]